MSYELDKIRSQFFTKSEKDFFDLFNISWNTVIEKIKYQHPQFMLGNRIRPRLVYWGFSANDSKIDDDKLYTAVEIAVVIELLHKTSVILDDYIDDDDARRGEASFHSKYGSERTIMLALNLIGQAINKINLLVANKKITQKEYNDYISIFTELMIDMSDGVMQELDLDDITKYDITTIKKICDKETAILLTNSILLGYYAGGGNNIKVLDELETIGMKCGYLFQMMNDMEAWCQTSKNVNYKGKLNLDVENNRKSVVMCVLYDSLSRKEKESVDTAFGDSKSRLCLELFKKYSIEDSLIAETQLISDDIAKRIHSLNGILSQEWCDAFGIFIRNVYKLCLKRLTDAC